VTKDFSDRDLRDALSSFATGVTIITANDDNGEPVGMTASSFNSVSMDPPLILWSVTKSALSAEIFKNAQFFAVHVLSSDQADLSNKFARRGENKFEGTGFQLDKNNVPILPDTAARFDCSKWAVYEGGDHWIIVGEVQNLEAAKKQGLVFGGGIYATAAPLIPAKQSQSGLPSGSGAVEEMLFYHVSSAYHQMCYDFHGAVHDSGLSIAEWRICACLYGQSTCSVSDLTARTFLDKEYLVDVFTSMAEQGLCTIGGTNEDPMITGTIKGDESVSHLFVLADEQEKSTLMNVSEDDTKNLVTTLKRMVSNIQKQP